MRSDPRHRRRSSHLTTRLSGGDDHIPEEKDAFDANGFAGYLAPYALAFLVTVAATFAFVKFVLLDY